MSRIDKFGGTNTPQSSDELHEKSERTKSVSRAEETKDSSGAPKAGQDGVRKVLAPGDAERLMSQAGFARSKKKRPGDLDMGDSSQAPIPLPDDDVDAQVWSAEALTQVQAQLGVQSSLLRTVRQEGGTEGGLRGLWQAMVGAAFGEGSHDAGSLAEETARLQALMDNPPPDAQVLLQMAQGAQAHFGIELTALEPGAQMMAASLLVAGQKEQVAVVADPAQAGAPKQLDRNKLTAGVESVLDGGRAAVDDGRRMNEGVVKHLAMHRTFVAKR